MPLTLPTGTVTFLFTDIEGSTRLLSDLGDRYADVLANQHTLLQGIFQQHGGQVVDTQGDAIFVAFPRAKDALAAAVAAQRALARHRWPGEAEVRVRMGLHTGEPLRTEPSYVGMDVHRAARICAAGHGGQILVSETTHALVQDDLSDAVGLRDLREHRLKDLARPQRIFQVVVGDMASEFPPLRSLNSLPNNLPLQLTSFLGRTREMADIKALLRQSRLVTLTGAGGAGKTRLALQVGADVLEEYGDGVWVVELAPLADSILVPQTLAAVLNLREQPGRAVEATIIDYLRPRHLLLVWDNCEHLLTACASLAEKLMRTCPKLHLLATSREGLAIGGEVTYRVPSLGVPDPRRLPAFATVAQEEAVRLFVERATFALPQFSLTERNAAAVVQICHRLDGIPLALEMAAGRVKGLSVEQIASRLDDCFRLLTGGSRTALPRQQTLRAAIDWSYGLLSEAEQILLRRLAVFVGGWTLEAAEAVCVGDAIDPADVLDLLMRIVDKSLVLTEGMNGKTRYRFLETVRQYALEKLIDAGEAQRMRERNQNWFVELAEQAEPNLTGPDQVAWLGRLELEHHNFRAALEWSKVGDASSEIGLRLAAALWRFWNVRGYLREGREWLEGTLARARNAPPELRLKALFGTGVLAWSQEDTSAAGPLEGSLTLARELGDRRAIADSLRLLALVARDQLDYDRARALGEESLGLFRELQDTAGISTALRFLAFHAANYDEFDRSNPAFEESLKLAQTLEDKRGMAWSLVGLAGEAAMQGDYVKAVTLSNEALSTFRDLGDKFGILISVRTLGVTARYRGEYKQAVELLEETLHLERELGYRATLGRGLRDLGLVAQDQGDYEGAKRLFEESLALLREAGDKWARIGGTWARADVVRALGVIAQHEGDYPRAKTLLEESLALFRETRNRRLAAQALDNLGAVARRQGDEQRARAFYQESLALRQQLRDKRGVAESLENLAGVAVDQRTFGRAATLLGAAEALREAISTPLPPAARSDYESNVHATQAGIGEEVFREAWTRGRRMSKEEAIAFGLKEAEGY